MTLVGRLVRLPFWNRLTGPMAARVLLWGLFDVLVRFYLPLHRFSAVLLAAPLLLNWGLGPRAALLAFAGYLLAALLLTRSREARVAGCSGLVKGLFGLPDGEAPYFALSSLALLLWAAVSAGALLR